MMNSWEVRVNEIMDIIDNFSLGKIIVDQANMTEYKRVVPMPIAQDCSVSNHSITVNPYNEKSIVIRGNTLAIRQKLKEFGAIYNKRLNGGPGWIISIKHENQFRHEFAQYI